MALYNAMLGRSDAALDLVLEALDLAPANPDLQLQAAQTYQQLGRTEEALVWLGKVVAEDPSPAMVLQNPWFESIRNTAGFQALMTPP